MDIDYKELISFSKLKTYLKDDGRSLKWLADKCGIDQTRISAIVRNIAFPKTDVIAKIAFILKVPVSQIVEFKMNVDEKKKAWFENKMLPYSPDGESKGEVTYEPLRSMMTMYLDYINAIKDSDKTADDLFDMIEPYRRRNGIKSGVNAETARAGVEARFGKGYKSARTDRKYVTKGLIPETRRKLKTDKAVNIRTIYDICNFFGCSIDWVMSYK